MAAVSDDLPTSGRVSRAFDPQACAAFISYAVLSFLFFGRGLLPNFSSYHIGTGPDPAQSIWYLAWWAHALAHRQNPFFTDVLFVPHGASLAWTTDVPIVSFLAAPLTAAIGPVAAYNALMLLSPAVAAWSCFVLCRYLARNWRAGWLGGFIFGFSPYVAGGMLGHLDLLLIFPIPLLLWFALRRLAEEISAARFISGTALLLIIEFTCFAELFATTAFFCAMATVFGLMFTDGEQRRRLRALVLPICSSYAIAVLMVSPLLYLMFENAPGQGVVFSPWQFSGDLLGLFLPTPANQLGRLTFLGNVTKSFRSGFGENYTFIAPPLLIISIIYAHKFWRSAQGRLLIDLLIVGCVLSLGPWLQIAGRVTIGLPWLVLEDIPLLGKALPVRFAVYVFLVLAIIVSIWLRDSRSKSKWLLGMSVVPFTFPALSARFWVQPLNLPRFFSSGIYRNYIAPDETVLVLPFGAQGDDMLWQASTGMYFRLAGGFLGYAPLLPEEYAQWPIAPGLYNVAGVPDASEQMKAFIAAHSVGTVIVANYRYQGTRYYDGGPTPILIVGVPVGPRERDELDRCLGALGAPHSSVGGIRLYKIEQGMIRQWRRSALEMQQRAADARFRALLRGTSQYLAAGGDLGNLSIAELQKSRLVPVDWFGGDPFPSDSGNPVFRTGSMIQAGLNGKLTIGIETSYAAAKPIIEHYGPLATAVYFPFAGSSTPRISGRDGAQMLAIVFDRKNIARAAEAAEAVSPAVSGGGIANRPRSAPTGAQARFASKPATR